MPEGPVLALYSFPFQALGTECHVHVYAEDPASARRVGEAARAEVARIEARYSRFLPGSFLVEINRVAAQGGELEVDPETAGLLDFAWACHEQSGGLFDLSAGLLRQVWDFKSGRLPDPEAVAALLPRVGLARVIWAKPWLRFPEPGMELDLGGLGKEYAADCTRAVCSALGVRHGLVDLGGDIAVIGPHPDGAPWRIGVQFPGRPGTLMTTVDLKAGALASSGDYERYIMSEGIRYGHILDPRSGWPARGLCSVSAVAEQCLVAGSIATIAVLKGAEGPAWLGTLAASHCWMDEDGRQGGPLLETGPAGGPIFAQPGGTCPAEWKVRPWTT